MSEEIREWVRSLPDAIADWTLSVASPDRTGFFRACGDAEMSFDFPSSSVCRGFLAKTRPEARAELDRLNAETAAFVQSCQQRETGLFIDPCLDPRFQSPDDARALRDFRHAVSKYTLGLLSSMDAEPLHPYAETGEKGVPDAEAYLAYLKAADWTRPWGTGSHTAGQTRELFNLLDQGHEELLPVVREGIENILSHQNPETGMWGPSSIPLYEQISGTLKVVGRFLFSLGIDIPHAEKLADSCIKHHADRSFYADGEDMCFPRNVAEMCVACMELSDYRRDELAETLEDIAGFLRRWQMPDGAFASNPKGTGPIGWCGASICGRSPRPRSNVNGTQGAVWCLGMIGEYLGWEGMPFSNPQGGWRERVARRRYAVEILDGGRVEIVAR